MIRNSLKYIIPIWWLIWLIAIVSYGYALGNNIITLEEFLDLMSNSSFRFIYYLFLITGFTFYFWCISDSRKRFNLLKEKKLNWTIYIVFTFGLGLTHYYYKYGKIPLDKE